LYDAVHAHDVHFSDHRVALYNTFDYPSYALAVEKLKAAFGIAYSLFDKTAVFLNAYMKLGIDEQKIYFRSIWYKNQDARQRILHPEFEAYENWPLRASIGCPRIFSSLAFGTSCSPTPKRCMTSETASNTATSRSTKCSHRLRSAANAHEACGRIGSLIRFSVRKSRTRHCA
jgi:hypothetical protein